MLRARSSDSFVKLDPRKLTGNPVILATEIVAVLATVSTVDAFVTGASPWWAFQIALWLWFTVLFANFAESIAEGRGKAAADALRAQRVDVKAKLIVDDTGPIVPTAGLQARAPATSCWSRPATWSPSDGEIIEGVASVNEAAITGESAPVIRESGGDRSAVTGGTTVVSDWIKVRITAEPGDSFLDRMIAMVEGAERRKTPNEMALTVLLAGLTLIFLIAVATLLGLGQILRRQARPAGAGRAVHLPDPDHHRRPAVGHRHRRHGPAAEVQRAGHLRPRGRGLGRRRHPAARQDRHHHPRQPHGHRGDPGAGRAAGGGDAAPR